MRLCASSAQAHSTFSAQQVGLMRSEERLERHAGGLRRRVAVLEQELAEVQDHPLGTA